MCPLRIILVFLSATLAGYFAWRSIRSDSPPSSPLSDSSEEAEVTTGDAPKSQGFDARKMIGDGFWMFVDMASGKYLWKAMKER